MLLLWEKKLKIEFSNLLKSSKEREKMYAGLSITARDGTCTAEHRKETELGG